jgi:PIN domain nuclease of toxin-antitoxin system
VNLLLDTHVVIWWLEKNPRLGPKTKAMLRDPDTLPWVSAATVWEVSIKAALKRLELAEPPEVWVPRLLHEWGVRELPISFTHAMAVRTLPLLHHDPFDRMLIAQAQGEDLTLVTADPAIMAYDVRTIDAST